MLKYKPLNLAGVMELADVMDSKSARTVLVSGRKNARFIRVFEALKISKIGQWPPK